MKTHVLAGTEGGQERVIEDTGLCDESGASLMAGDVGAVSQGPC